MALLDIHHLKVLLFLSDRSLQPKDFQSGVGKLFAFLFDSSGSGVLTDPCQLLLELADLRFVALVVGVALLFLNDTILSQLHVLIFGSTQFFVESTDCRLIVFSVSLVLLLQDVVLLSQLRLGGEVNHWNEGNEYDHESDVRDRDRLQQKADRPQAAEGGCHDSRGAQRRVDGGKSGS